MEKMAFKGVTRDVDWLGVMVLKEAGHKQSCDWEGDICFGRLFNWSIGWTVESDGK